jgi:hypothetical protein
MKRIKLKSVVVGVACVILAGYFLLFNSPKDPNHAGRPVSAWFQDLYSGVFGGTAKAKGFAAGYAAFSQMEPEAVPYLTKQLRYDRSGIRQKTIVFLRRYSITKPLTRDMIWPPDWRSYAAVALRQMGKRAEAAIPALLETWAHDAPDVKLSAVSALEAILHGSFTGGASSTDSRKIEAAIIAEAGRRYPKVAAELGIKID